MATVVSITNPVTGAVEQVDKLDHTAQQIDDAAALAPQLSNPNLLDNWYFGNPVNQRGQTEYTGAKYCIDRWVQSRATSICKVIDGAVALQGIAFGYVSQYIESPERISDKTVTMSALIKNPNGRFRLCAYNATVDSGAISVDIEASQNVTLVKKTFTTSINSGEQFGILLYPGANDATELREATVYAVKLELGSQQTLAHQDVDGNWVLNEIPDYGEQLRRCQRYFQLYSAANERPAKAVDCRPVMRTDPSQGTIAIDSATYYYNTAEL